MTLVKYRRPLFTDFFPSPFSHLLDGFADNTQSRDPNEVRFVPSVDVAEHENQFEISVALPGFKKADISVEVEDGTLKISGKRDFKKEEKEGSKYHTVETQYGYFQRAFQLPDTVNAEKIDAQFTDGLLQITLPKAPKVERKSLVTIK